ncbi:MAG: hypothetical protein JXR97_14640 [Planctomycetes bacterium]|nr:hypothetical protein [Planctomycetota bacterium]
MNNALFIIAIIAMLALASTAGSGLSAENTLSVNFDNSPQGKLEKSELENLFGKLQWQSLNDRAEIVAEKGRGNVLRIKYPKGSVGSQAGGSQFVVKLEPAEEYWLGYSVKFEKGFDLKRGGKLPGLTSGGGKFTGGHGPKNGEGWSARYMWWKGDKVILYFYHAGMKEKYGDVIPFEGKKIIPGEWHRLVQHIKLNTGNNSDGTMEVWFDGDQVLKRNDVLFRLNDQGKVDSFYFSTFHGGNNESWAPEVDSYARFDDFVISRKPIDTSAAGKGAEEKTEKVKDKVKGK